MRWLPLTSLGPRSASAARRRINAVGYQNNGDNGAASTVAGAVRLLGSTTTSGGQGSSITLGFVGLGQMGARMAANLLSKVSSSRWVRVCRLCPGTV